MKLAIFILFLVIFILGFIPTVNSFISNLSIKTTGAFAIFNAVLIILGTIKFLEL